MNTYAPDKWTLPKNQIEPIHKRLDMMMASQEHVNCALILGQKDVILGLEDRIVAIQIAGATEKPAAPGLTKTSSNKMDTPSLQTTKSQNSQQQASQIKPKELPTCRFEGKVMDLAILGNEFLVIAEGNIDPANTQVIKIFKGSKLVKEITEPKFRPGYYPYHAICPFNAYGRVFEVVGDRIMFNAQDWKIYSIKIAGNNLVVQQEFDLRQKLNHFRVVANYGCLFGITTDKVIKAMMDNSNPQITKSVEYDKALTAVEFGAGFVFVAQHSTLQPFYGDNALIILDHNLKERHKFQVEMRESIRHLKYFNCKGIHYLMFSSFGYDSMLMIYEFITLDASLSCCRKVVSANNNLMCSWVNYAVPICNSGNVLTVGPLGHCVVHRFRLDFN